MYILFIFVHMQNAFQCSHSLLVTRCLKEDLKHVSKFLLVPCSSKVNVHAIVIDSFSLLWPKKYSAAVPC